MAKATKQSTRKRSAGKAGSAADAGRDPVDAMLDLVAEQGWRQVTLTRIAEASGMSLGTLYQKYTSKTDMLTEYAHRIDAAMLAGLGDAVPHESYDAALAKDRLFEAVMARLDALTPHKAAIRVLMRELPADPAALACFLYGGLRQGLDWTLASAGLDQSGLAGILRRKTLGAVYLDTLRVWLKDESADLSATMAHLDKRLGQAMRFLTARSPISHMRDKATT
ncbi:MAG: TetR family transcriptional regulator [Ferrovibrio sp.]|uniref:TetR family transcriptional regulator n=1 Tax=Ferrovibrio sp. TaxID=1917215 RepID=UPI00391CB2E4